MDEPVINVRGERVGLGPLRRDLVGEYQRWYNDAATNETKGLSWPTTFEQELEAYERRISNSRDIYFTLYELETLRPIGLTYLYEVDARHARGSFGIMIGVAECRGKGYGTEATGLVLDYAFNVYGLQNVSLTVLEHNAGGIRAYEKVGFREFGRRHRCSRIGQKLWDIIYMECLPEWFEPSQVEADQRS